MMFHDGEFTFYTAVYGSAYNDARIVFRVRSDQTAMQRAAEKSIRHYDRLLLSNKHEISHWLKGHSEYKPLNEVRKIES